MKEYIKKLPLEISIEEIEKSIEGKSNYDKFIKAVKLYAEKNKKRFQEAYQKDEDLKNQFETFESFYETIIIRKIYMTLGMRFKFDLNYWFGTRKEKIKIFQKEPDVQEMMNDYIGNCRALSFLMKSILDQINIKSKIIQDVHCNRKYAPHTFILIEPLDKKIPEYIIDLEDDLRRIQSNSYTLNFGIAYRDYILSDYGIENLVFSKRTIETFDKITNYPLNGKPYANGYGDLLKWYSSLPQELDESNLEWIRAAIENLEPYKTPQLKGRDRLAYHKKRLGEAFSSTEPFFNGIYKCGKYKIYSVDGYFQKDKLIEYIVIAKNEPLLMYRYNEEENRFVEEPIDTFISNIKKRIYNRY